MLPEMIYAYLLGLLSILSPCTFIIVPVMTSDLNTRLNKVVSFLGGITITFGLLGILSALTGKLLTNFIGGYLYFFAGIISLISGLNMLNIIELNFPSFFSNIKTRNNFFLGLIYGGIALSCVGPLLATILSFIVVKASITYGFIMMYIFSLGFITPFLLFGFLITDKNITKKLMRHTNIIKKIGGIVILSVSIYLLYISIKGII